MGQVAILRLLLEAAPHTAMATAQDSKVPLLVAAAGVESVEAVQLLLEAAPQAAMVRTATDGATTLHCAVRRRGTHAVEVTGKLVEAAPEAAFVEDHLGRTPMAAALHAQNLAAARVLLAAPGQQAGPALRALAQAPPACHCLYADTAARWTLRDEEWKLVPAPCPGLGAALPAVLARSEHEAGCLVARLSAEEQWQLQAAALSLARVQRTYCVNVPLHVNQRMLALSVA